MNNDCKDYKAMRGYVIYSPGARPKVNTSHIHKVPKNGQLIFHMGEVSELWHKAMANISRVFNLNNCSVVLKM